ncbi:MAG TPA: ABC transporter ATP-binding protein [Chthoniobacterales bacterium]|nr:ABC transporter ATP-binding protein [Chthoniobacterales bacterium]
MPFLIRVFSYLVRYPRLALGTFFCAIASTLMVAVFPAVTQQVIDQVLSPPNGTTHTEHLLPLLTLGLGAFFLRDLLNALRIFLNNHFEQRVIFDLRSDLYKHIQSLSLSWFDQRATGDIMTRLMEDVTSVERVLIDGIEQGTVSVLQISIVLGLMLHYSPLLTAAAFAPFPFLTAGALIYTLTANRRYHCERKSASVLNALLHDNIDGIRQIKTYTSEEREHCRFNIASDGVRRAMLRVMKAWAIYSPTMDFLSSLGMMAILSLGAYQVLHHQMDLGILVAFLVLARYLYEPIELLHRLNQLFQAGRVAGQRLFSIMDEPTEQDREKKSCFIPSSPLRGDVQFYHVAFSYQANLPVLHDISLHAHPGEIIALVGSTGSGKSSLVNLLSRFYEFTNGEILIDGHPLRDLSLDFLRRSIGMVTQESFLFNGTTADNLRIGSPEATEEEMWKALTAANAEGFVRRLPQGLHTPLGERGIKLSVGEKQRLSIARALLKNPPILILDEATASVDNTTERLIQEALHHLLTGRTSFVIAHRLSTIRNADQILVLDHGMIVEHGTHRELLAKEGAYAKLYHEAETTNADQND